MKKKIKKSDGDKNLKEQLARALADYDNLRKRIERERDESERYANARLIGSFLPILDMLYGVQDHLNDSGLAITIKEFEEVLKDEGIEKIKVEKGGKFDEDLHEVVEVVKNTKAKASTIAEVTLVGWKFGDDTVIRPAKVRVYKK